MLGQNHLHFSSLFLTPCKCANWVEKGSQGSIFQLHIIANMSVYLFSRDSVFPGAGLMVDKLFKRKRDSLKHQHYIPICNMNIREKWKIPRFQILLSAWQTPKSYMEKWIGAIFLFPSVHGPVIILFNWSHSAGRCLGGWSKSFLLLADSNASKMSAVASGISRVSWAMMMNHPGEIKLLWSSVTWANKLNK